MSKILGLEVLIAPDMPKDLIVFVPPRHPEEPDEELIQRSVVYRNVGPVESRKR